MGDFIETYGYPKEDFLGKNTIRQSIGWFFIGLDKDEPACYMDFYFIVCDDNVLVAVMLLDYFHMEKEINLDVNGMDDYEG